MALTIVRHDESAELIPQMRFCMVQSDKAVFADTRSELVAHLIDGYPEGEDEIEGRFTARFAFLHELAVTAAHNAYQGAIDDGLCTPDDFTNDEIDLMLNLDRSIQRFTGSWNHVVPLFMMSTCYAPFTSDQLPTGNVHILDPTNETGFLQTLVDAGLIQLLTHDDLAAQEH